MQRATSEEAAAYSREAIELLPKFAVGEGVIISNPKGDGARGETPGLLGDRIFVAGDIVRYGDRRFRANSWTRN